MENETISEGNSLTEKQIAKSVKYLKSAFYKACESYRESNGDTKIQTFVSRKKVNNYVPIFDKGVDYTLYHAEIEFAYVLDEIQRGPRAFAANEIKNCNNLIDSLSK